MYPCVGNTHGVDRIKAQWRLRFRPQHNPTLHVEGVWESCSHQLPRDTFPRPSWSIRVFPRGVAGLFTKTRPACIMICSRATPNPETALNGNRPELVELLDKSFAIMKDEDAGSSRLLQCARRCGWLSYQANPLAGLLVRSDSFEWAQHFEERSAGRTPRDWWAARYQWIDEDGVPCVRMTEAWSKMEEECPERSPNDQRIELKSIAHGQRKCAAGIIDFSRDEIMTFQQSFADPDGITQEFVRSQMQTQVRQQVRASRTIIRRHQGRRAANKQSRISEAASANAGMKRSRRISSDFCKLASAKLAGCSVDQLLEGHVSTACSGKALLHKGKLYKSDLSAFNDQAGPLVIIFVLFIDFVFGKRAL